MGHCEVSAAISTMEPVKYRLLRPKGLAMTVGTNRLLHCVRNDGGETKSRTKGHCERNEVERGNLIKGTRIEQIASAKMPRNDSRDKQIASRRSQ